MQLSTDHSSLRTRSESIEWEELPSLAQGLVLRRHVPRSSYALAAELVADARSRIHSEPPIAPAWVETAAADLEPLRPSAPLVQTSVDGLEAREILEPDVFKHFFGNHRR